MARKRSLSTQLRARWVEQVVLSARRKMLPNLVTYQQIADRIGTVGRAVARGEKLDPQRIGIEVPPEGIVFTEDYSISDEATRSALTHALARIPLRDAEEYRKIDTERCEEMYSRLRARIIDGNPFAVKAAISLLAHMAKINGYVAPTKLEVTGRDGSSLIPGNEEYERMLNRLSEEDQLAMLALLNKARGGPERSEQPVESNGNGSHGGEDTSEG